LGGGYFFSSNQLPFNKLHNKQQREKEKIKEKSRKIKGKGENYLFYAARKRAMKIVQMRQMKGNFSKGKTARKSGSCIGD